MKLIGDYETECTFLQAENSTFIIKNQDTGESVHLDFDQFVEVVQAMKTIAPMWWKESL